MRRTQVEALRGRAMRSSSTEAEPMAFVRTQAKPLPEACDKALAAEDKDKDPPQMELDL